MKSDAKYIFLKKLSQLAEELYKHGDSLVHDAAWENRRSYLRGYGDAGKTIGLVTAKDIQTIIDRAHERIYGESRLARRERLKPLVDGPEEPDWDSFDSPTYERRLGKTED
jgi:hypothetical protein